MTDNLTKGITPAQAKRILQDWIEDDDHAASLSHWPDLREAYEALKAVAESLDEPSSKATHRFAIGDEVIVSRWNAPGKIRSLAYLLEAPFVGYENEHDLRPPSERT